MTTPAVVLAQGLFTTSDAKVAHGLVRGSDRYRVLAVIDPQCAGRDAGEVLDGRPRGIPVLADLQAALRTLTEPPTHAVVGAATHGGRFTPEVRAAILAAIEAGLSVVNGLHEEAGADPEMAAAARVRGVELIDVRRPPPRSHLHFWEGRVLQVAAPRIAVLGTDCAVGKRTTTRLLAAALNSAGIHAVMIHTGQTGWMQGAPFGIVLDSLPNDFVAGELEQALCACDRELQPDVMLIEGQSALRHPAGPCGAELLLAGQAHAVVLQHAVGREYFEGFAHLGLRIPPLSDEIDLIGRYGARTLAVTLNGADSTAAEFAAEQVRLGAELGIPVVRILEEGAGALVPIVRAYLQSERAGRTSSRP